MIPLSGYKLSLNETMHLSNNRKIKSFTSISMTFCLFLQNDTFHIKENSAYTCCKQIKQKPSDMYQSGYIYLFCLAIA